MPATQHLQAQEQAQDRTRPDDTRFTDVLQEYQDFNRRIQTLAAPLRIQNKHLCSSTERDPGFTTHKVSDYPPNMQLMAQELLGLNAEGVFIKDVRSGSPAYTAGLRAEDQILTINGKAVPNIQQRPRFYAALSRNAFNASQTSMRLRRQDGEVYSASLRARTACNIPASVVFSKNVNAYTDGREVFITSALMQTTHEDLVLSLLLAHEMAHVIAGHAGRSLSQALEIEADGMALVLMVNAGLDIDRAIDLWAKANHALKDSQADSVTHPDINARYENFRKVQDSLESLGSLDLNYLPDP